MTKPRTEAGRTLLDNPSVLLLADSHETFGINEGELELHILAIEAEALTTSIMPCPECRKAVQAVRANHSPSGDNEYLRLEGFDYGECFTCVKQ